MHWLANTLTLRCAYLVTSLWFSVTFASLISDHMIRHSLDCQEMPGLDTERCNSSNQLRMSLSAKTSTARSADTGWHSSGSYSRRASFIADRMVDAAPNNQLSLW